MAVIKFTYINIIDSELDVYKELANCLRIKNLKYHKEDVRNMEFNDNTFDKVITISVIEHVYPEKDGDMIALGEIKRVLKPDGNLLLTIPYKSKHNIVYSDGPVYDKE
jgi:ubiquinone/menaquinone biosynthesis C-methylase UbiE